MKKQDTALLYLIAIFAGSLVIANVLASKILNFAGFMVPAGVLAYSVTFICTDVLGELWGKEEANKMVKAGFITTIVVLALIQLSIIAPSAPFWKGQSSFVAVLGSSMRIIIASLIAYLVSQSHDVWIFHLLKEKMSGKHLWLRNNLSTTISQLLDTIIFITIAFVGKMPIMPMIFGQFIVKMIIAIIDTPIVYLVVYTLKSKIPALAEQN